MIAAVRTTSWAILCCRLSVTRVFNNETLMAATTFPA
jgi:hypothetical protein